MVCIGWLIDYSLLYVSRILHLYGDVNDAGEGPMLGAQGIWAGSDFYRATPAVTRDLGFPVSSEGPPHLDASYDIRGYVMDLF
jgi:hypothetical protein